MAILLCVLSGVRKVVQVGRNLWPRQYLVNQHSYMVTYNCPNVRASHDYTARLWDSTTGECLKIFSHHQQILCALTFSPDGRWFCTGGRDGWLYIYNVKVALRVLFPHFHIGN